MILKKRRFGNPKRAAALTFSTSKNIAKDPYYE
jgi:hypothetical protein